ncbi:MAG: 3-hydroxyacyl-CoA dehydrogenase/enoyl-CoA hydratase family protein [Chloroflexi bacterium]|nr:3-hydroxyacyl-CoA dehydrogenase/enoyl-CoA hydratase family protein [Chloroflexota bacterium]MCI0576045.1 3-hydroxyacyl-CoA dehydrogenase/enoyl-CoA hydratase family protein [Chloroflexota bacterium]MCI0647833.1 3-hydroxyacyl-CoA dehydrogenase/enoyl-CoA hydratase family protein [Chloroflexota bacterium]MCI0727084.1 3-hydroxyacyl-CoA dehydrogenase/enoyl-CoA hydratase family protein [Chloroflexota bacterium]
MSFRIHKAAVIGAGTMGGGIAAHLANIGIEVVLLDIPTPNLSEAERDNPAARNRLVRGLYDRMASAKPAHLARPDRANLITAVGNTEDDFDKLADCDWIVEVIIEQLAPKQALMERIEAVRKPGSLVSSNTSGIPINEIAAGRSADFKAHFLGTHFFNPPRYLKLLEVIPTAETAPEVVDFMIHFGRDVLGKGVVVCKDTPNFIGNRYFAIAASYGIEYALEHGYTVAEVDALTGPLVGRPKTATFRLMDLVGLDVMGHVNRNLYPAIAHDPYRDVLVSEKSAGLIGRMIGNGWLGNKSGQGFYLSKNVGGERQFWQLNLETMAYEPPQKVRFESVGEVRNIEDLGERLRKLLTFHDRAAQYVRHTLYYALSYAAHVAPEIAYWLKDVDDAVRWGFAHEAGPFELWDMLGVGETAAEMEAAGYEVAGWVREMLATGHESFYRNGSYYDFEAREYRPKPVDAKLLSIEQLRRAGKEVKRNMSASLLDMGDGVALLEMHAPKINAVDPDFIQMAAAALERLNSDFDALVIGNEGQDFCIGANIALLAVAAAQGLWDQVDLMLHTGQKVFYNLRHAPKPVVTAPHQRVLGGGVELTMASWATVADHETYMGLVEVGVGIIPSWGGCTELLRRKVNPVMRTANADVLPVMQEVFEQIATAKVGASAWEDKALGYLRPEDEVAMNSDHRLAMAKRKALELVAAGTRPPEVEKVYAAGRDTLAALELGVTSFVWAGYASEHDAKISKKLAYVLCGGDLSAPAWVDPWYILDLEREAVLSLAGEPKTQERVMYMLQTGKPLRN